MASTTNVKINNELSGCQLSSIILTLITEICHAINEKKSDDAANTSSNLKMPQNKPYIIRIS